MWLLQNNLMLNLNNDKLFYRLRFKAFAFDWSHFKICLTRPFINLDNKSTVFRSFDFIAAIESSVWGWRWRRSRSRRRDPWRAAPRRPGWDRRELSWTQASVASQDVSSLSTASPRTCREGDPRNRVEERSLVLEESGNRTRPGLTEPEGNWLSRFRE